MIDLDAAHATADPTGYRITHVHDDDGDQVVALRLTRISDDKAIGDFTDRAELDAAAEADRGAPDPNGPPGADAYAGPH